MAKPIATVQLGIARLGLEISDCATDADLVAWVKSFHRALALQKPPGRGRPKSRTPQRSSPCGNSSMESGGIRRKSAERRGFLVQSVS